MGYDYPWITIGITIGITKVGPELWRLDVPNARRARAWVRGWVEPETQPPAQPCAAPCAASHAARSTSGWWKITIFFMERSTHFEWENSPF